MTGEEPKTVEVTVLSLEEEFKIAMQKATRDQELFELVCRSLRLRENQFFGLYFEDDKKAKYWLKKNRNVLEQLPKAQNIRLTFSVRFYPEDLEQELIEDRTRHIFYLHIKRLVQAGEIRSLHEDVVRLAALAAQAKYGDFKENFLTNMSLTYLLPHYTLDDYLVTKNVWICKIETCWREYYGFTNEEGELEYLKLARKFDMFGMEYFDVKDGNKLKCLLAIGPKGLVLCEKENKKKKLSEFNWNQIENFMIRSRKVFIIKMKADNETSAKNQIYYVKKAKMNKLLFEQSVGNHELYKKRKLPDSVDLQHMKLHALEDRERRKEEHTNLINERKRRQDAAKRCDEAEFQLQKFQLAATAAKEALQNSEKCKQNLLEKLHQSEEEANLLKLASSETSVQRSQLLSALSVVYAIINNYYAENSEQERSEILQKIQGALLLLEVLPPDFFLTLMADCLVSNLPPVEELQPLLNVGIMKLPKVSPV